jgi:tripartite ATP-independent transporter DctM subunit
MSGSILAGLVVFSVGLVLGLPLCWVFLAASATIILVLQEPLTMMAGAAFFPFDNYLFMAIAFFVFAGSLMSECGIADRFVRFAHAMVGHIRGGLVDVGVVATLFLSALTGSSVPCVAALVPLLVPRLEQYGIQRRFSTAVICSSSFLGYLIPPSIPVLIYCLVAQQSVAALFLSTIFPGLLIAAGYMVLNTILSKRYTTPAFVPVQPVRSMAEWGRGLRSPFWNALPALSIPAIVLGGIYTGVFTPNEAGAIAVVASVVVGFVYRELNRTKILKSTQTTVVTLGMIALLIGFGTVFTRLLIREGAAQALATGVLSVFDSRIGILLMLNLFLLIMGMFIDGTPILIIVVPLLLPLVGEIDVNLVQLGAIIIVNVGLGVCTPPYAISILVGSRLANIPYGDLVPPMLMYLLFVGIPVLLLTTLIPALTCWLPTAIVGPEAVGAW